MTKREQCSFVFMYFLYFSAIGASVYFWGKIAVILAFVSIVLLFYFRDMRRERRNQSS